MASIEVTGPGGKVHDLEYDYDTFGYLDFQQVRYAGATSTETFEYDDLHRLTRSSRVLPGGTSIVDYSYDAAGNLLAKSDYATSYSYNGSQPNAVSSIAKVGGGSASFSYDANGNRLTGDGKSLTYTAFNMPATIAAGGITASFYYGADLSRYKQSKTTGQTTLYLDKLMEIVSDGGDTDYRHYLGDVAILTKNGDLNDSYPDIAYLHRDRLGSLATITDETGGNAQTRGFDPFGKPRDGDWADRSPPVLHSAITERGFTEHEHLDESQLIHMNGRVYDYQLGRFLSVDPVIQAPGNSQSLNPYSYIMNNPLAGTDPSGYEIEIVIRCGINNPGCDHLIPIGDVATTGDSSESQSGNSRGESDSVSRSNGSTGDIPTIPDHGGPITEIESNRTLAPRGTGFASYDSIGAIRNSLAAAGATWIDRQGIADYLSRRNAITQQIAGLKSGYWYHGRAADIGTLNGQIGNLDRKFLCQADLCGLETSTPFLSGIGVAGMLRIATPSAMLSRSSLVSGAGPTIARVQGLLARYPKVIDSRTGRAIPFPSGITGRVPTANRVPWGAQQRGEYIAEWHRRGLPEPRGGWRNYDIHHIQPREFGGGNNFWNLVPVERGTHQSLFNQFWREFNGL